MSPNKTIWFFVAALAFWILLIFTGNCSRPEEAKRVLTEQGYTEIETLGYRWFGCGSEDGFSDGFSATSPSGARVEGVVCGGWGKGMTIRFDATSRRGN